MQEDRKYIPARLRQARISRGLSMAELSNSIDVTRQAISQYEIGTIEPSDYTMRSIVDVLRYPIDFFIKPIPDLGSNFSQSSIYYRKKKGAPVKLKDAAKERVNQFAEIDYYFRKFVDFPKVNVPQFHIENYVDEVGNIDTENIAKELRNYWGLDDGPIPNLDQILEKNGFMISTMQNKHNKIDAFSQWYKNGIPYIFFGSEKQSSVRYRFDLAHELGHLIMHNHITEEDLLVPSIYNRIEDEANRFAGAFLLPKSSFVPQVYSTSIDHFLMLKKKWKVSVSAMIYRIQSLDLLTPSQIKYIKDQMTYRKYWQKEPYDDDIKAETPVSMMQAFDLLIDNNIITANSFLDENPYYPEELETICFFRPGTLTQSTNMSAKIIKLKF